MQFVWLTNYPRPSTVSLWLARFAFIVHLQGGAVAGIQIRDRLAVFVTAASGLANTTSLDLRSGSGIAWGAAGVVTLHACGLEAGAWHTATREVGIVTATSFCLVANVTKSDLDGGALHWRSS